MQTALQGSDLTVAILMDDLGCAKEIAGALRQQNILAHLYQSLDEFWVASTVQTPDLAIVDVTKMSQGSIQFRSHPKVIDKSLCYAFFSKESTKVLLQSTLGLSPAGYLHYDVSLAAQVLALVGQRTLELRQERERSDLEARVQRLQARSQRLLSERSGAEEFRVNFDFIRTLCGEIEADSTRQDFTHSLIGKLEKWEAIDGYGIFELNPSGQKLMGPELVRKKYHPFPSLWLGQANLQGIEPFAQEMGTQVARDLFETEPVLVRISSGASNPDLLLYVSSPEARMADFPWDVLEAMLSSSLRKLRLYQQLPHYSSQFLPMWEALDDMDRMQKAGFDADVRIVSLSLIPLTDVAKRRLTNKFFWSSFFNDFFIQLSGRLQKSTKLSLFGPWHVMFFIPKESVEAETQMLQSFVKQFSYWKFFEDTAQVLSEDMLPVLKLVPPSSAHFLRLFEKEFSELALRDEEKRLLINRPNAKRITI